MTMFCPCCGHELTRPPTFPMLAIKQARMGKVWRAILEALVAAHPAHLSMDQIIDAAYGADPDGGPDYASGSVTVIIHKMRKSLAASGWTISNANYGSAGYRLEPLR